jgi:phosphoribosylglycinamide formyltransferase 2
MAIIVLLGSGELGKEFVISAKRLGHFVVAVDSYDDAPAMQVADRREVIDMLDTKQLTDVLSFWKPDYIVPEIEAIATEVLFDFEATSTVVPSARAVNLTMNRDKIRDRAYELGLKVAKFEYAESEQELVDAAIAKISSNKAVIKPVMSSSGKGQSIVDWDSDVDIELQVRTAWHYACENMRGNRQRVIIEEFIDFDSEITLLTIKQHDGPTLFCEPIGHYQERGDYQYSWQPAHIDSSHISQAQDMAKIITDDLGGAGLFGVEFFMTKDGPIFSELSPRPHDTGMATLQTQRYTQFDLHLRAITGLPIRQEHLECEEGASAVILADHDIEDSKVIGVSDAMELDSIDVRIFGKKVGRKNRRMGVVLGKDLTTTRKAATLIKVE